MAQWESPARGRGGQGGGGGGRGGPPPPPSAPQFGTLKVTTDHLTPGWLRRNGAPYSEGAVVEEYFDNIDSTNKDKWLIVTTTVKDPEVPERRLHHQLALQARGARRGPAAEELAVHAL